MVGLMFAGFLGLMVFIIFAFIIFLVVSAIYAGFECMSDAWDTRNPLKGFGKSLAIKILGKKEGE